jgi:poly-gamma-glutamate synthesis protein (capsule biosynthesis protein)
MKSIGFTGDFCPWERIETEHLKQQDQECFKSVVPFFEKNDLNIIDLECPLTNSSKKITKTGPHIKASPQTVTILNKLKCQLVATANNHFKDYGWEGMSETYDALKKNNIDWVGSGESFKDASKTYLWTSDELKVAVINCAENEWSTTIDEQPGCNSLDVVNIFNAIQESKKTADFTVVIVHGGHEHYNLPSPRMKKWYRFFVDAGSDAVIGHHTHIISGFEVYKDAPIFYSLGNFCFDWKDKIGKAWNKGMLVRLNFNKNQPVDFELEFINQNNEKQGVFLMDFEQKEEMSNHLKELNSIIANDDKLQNEFQKFCNLQSKVIQTRIQPYMGRLLPSLHKRKLIPSLIGKKKKLLLTNLIRCEAHRDILLNSIKPNK